MFQGRNGLGYVPGETGWSALLLIRGNAVTVVHDLLGQAARRGMSAAAGWQPDPAAAASREQARQRQGAAPNSDPPHADSPACQPILNAEGEESSYRGFDTYGLHCEVGAYLPRPGASGPNPGGLLIDATQGACAQTQNYCAGLLAPSFAIVSYWGAPPNGDPVPFPPPGWSVGQGPIVEPLVRMRIPTRIVPPGAIKRGGKRVIRIPDTAVALAPSRCSQQCNEDSLILRTRDGDGRRVLALLAHQTFRNRLFDGGPIRRRGRVGKWETHIVGMGDTDNGVSYTLYEDDRPGPDYITASFINGG